MRAIMGILKSMDGIYYVRKKVPSKLEVAVSTVLGAPRARVCWFKSSLRTKDLLAPANCLHLPPNRDIGQICRAPIGACSPRPEAVHLGHLEQRRAVIEGFGVQQHRAVEPTHKGLQPALVCLQ